nr:OTU domain-containing protein 3 isoform X2 [Rattus norvegicus]
MIRQREDFEPFVEDDIPFEKHVASLAKPGTFAGNDAIVAFARNHQLNVVIHQLNAPLWQIISKCLSFRLQQTWVCFWVSHQKEPVQSRGQIRGTDKSSARELHIAYRYGEHYDSVRRINDNSEAPAHLLTDFQMLHQDRTNKKEKMKTQGDSLRDDMEDAVQKAGSATGCTDSNLIVQNLEAESHTIEPSVTALLQMNQGTSKDAEKSLEPGDRVKQRGPSCEEAGGGSRLSGNQGRNEGRVETSEARASPGEESRARKKSQCPKVTNKQRREQQRLEKKKRQEERHRLKALENRNGSRDRGREADVNTQVTLVKTFAALNI